MRLDLDPGCAGKTRYPDRASALRCLDLRRRGKRLKRKGTGHANVYRCSSCRGWHIGSDSL